MEPAAFLAYLHELAGQLPADGALDHSSVVAGIDTVTLLAMQSRLLEVGGAIERARLACELELAERERKGQPLQ